ncbi:YtxH domain-containing protein [Spirillospora sp. NPDC048911]|uniref:YtxH domain-containing protein n=1 Tax=Spirillospora sp. NPDC048911 TaxID=3364527 RepID=UPI00371A5688
MKHRSMFIVGAAVGYVFGTRAGRERYEQIMRTSRRLAENPTVQETAGVLRAKGEEIAGAAKVKGGELADKAGHAVNQKLHKDSEYEDPRREPVS